MKQEQNAIDKDFEKNWLSHTKIKILEAGRASLDWARKNFLMTMRASGDLLIA